MQLKDQFKENNSEKISIYQYVDALVESYRSFSKERVQSLGLTHAEAVILIELSGNSNVTQKYLANKFNLSAGYTANVLYKLEERDYVQRHENPSNRREKLVSLTDSGKIEADKLNDIIDEWENLVCISETEEDMKTLKRILFNISKQTENL